MRRCEAIKANGEPCKSFCLRDDKYCFFHSSLERVQEIRHKPKTSFGRKKLLAKLGQDFDSIEQEEMPKIEKIKLRREIANLMINLMKVLSLPQPEKKQEDPDILEYIKRKAGRVT
jgi:hypothetical protein